MRTLMLIVATLSALAAGCGGDSADPGPSQAEQQAAATAEQAEDDRPSAQPEQDADDSSEDAAEDAVQQTEVEAPLSRATSWRTSTSQFGLAKSSLSRKRFSTPI